MRVSGTALQEWDTLCPDKSLKDLRRMVRHAAPVTHYFGNRRYDNYVFKVVGNTVHSVALYHTGSCCEVCGGRGYTEMHDQFLGRDVKVPCHNCG